MTIRSQINAMKRRTVTIALAAWLVMAAFGILAVNRPAFSGLGLLGIIGFLSAMLYMLFCVRCTACKEQILCATSWPPGGFFSISKKIRFCPFCGINLDSEV